jgi:hypothetical protein
MDDIVGGSSTSRSKSQLVCSVTLKERFLPRDT